MLWSCLGAPRKGLVECCNQWLVVCFSCNLPPAVQVLVKCLTRKIFAQAFLSIWAEFCSGREHKWQELLGNLPAPLCDVLLHCSVTESGLQFSSCLLICSNTSGCSLINLDNQQCWLTNGLLLHQWVQHDLHDSRLLWVWSQSSSQNKVWHLWLFWGSLSQSAWCHDIAW